MSLSSIVPSIIDLTLFAPYKIWTTSISDVEKERMSSPDKVERQEAVDNLYDRYGHATGMLKTIFRICLAAIAVFAVLKYKLNPTTAAVGGLLLSVPTVCIVGGTYVGYLAVTTIIKAVALNSLNLGCYGIGLGLASWGILDTYHSYNGYGVLETPVINHISQKLSNRVVQWVAIIGMNFCCYQPKKVAVK